MRIDAHQHYWKMSRGDCGWLTPDLGVLYRDYLPVDLRPFLDRHGIVGTVVVQAAPTVAETRFLLELAELDATIAGVVGWADMERPDFPRQLAELKRHPKFLGIRPMVQNMSDLSWLLRPEIRRAFRAVVDCDCTFDFLVLPRHLPQVALIVKEHPDLRCVIDHLAKPDIKAKRLEPWQSDLARIAEHPNVWCKLSGMVTEADHAGWQVDDLRPYVQHALSCFGPRRVMFGSDWPVCLLAADYDQVVAALRELLSEQIRPDERELVFGGNAAAFYRLGGA